jgi:hypothetical protein
LASSRSGFDRQGLPKLAAKSLERGVQLGPQLRGLLGLVGAEGGEVAADAGPSSSAWRSSPRRRPGDAVVAADDGLEVARLARGDRR